MVKAHTLQRSAMRNTMIRPLACKLSFAALVGLVVAGSGTAAFAHAGDHSHIGVVAGLLHPFSGLDHLLAMVAVGLWAVQLGRPALWLLPLTFPVVMAVGAALGISGVSLPFVEVGILGSVLVLGAAVALAIRLPLPASVALIALFGLLHGFAHGAELPMGASALAYGAGFIAATLVLHAIGIAAGLLAGRGPAGYTARRVARREEKRARVSQPQRVAVR
jgi:urease accessory protein